MLSMGISHPQIVLNVVLCLISLILLCNRRDVELNNRICKDPINSFYEFCRGLSARANPFEICSQPFMVLVKDI